ncbi:MAG: hypothetical protein ABDH28_04115 [Brevinematia bacterium]
MLSTQTLYKLFSAFLLITSAPLSISAVPNYVKLESSLSALKKDLSIEGNIKVWEAFVNICAEIVDYGEIKNYSLLNQEYYTENPTLHIYQGSVSTKLGFRWKNLFSFVSTKFIFLSFSIHSSFLHYYGIGTILWLDDKIKIRSEISEANFLSGELKAEIFVSYSDEFFKELSISLVKDINSLPLLEVFSEINMLKTEIIKVNLGAGYSYHFGPAPLYPYKLLIRIPTPYLEIYNLTRFSGELVEVSLGVKYNFN